MNEIVKVFNDRPVRIMPLDGEQWFVGKDVCNLLGYRNDAGAMNRHCYGGGKIPPPSNSRRWAEYIHGEAASGRVSHRPSRVSILWTPPLRRAASKGPQTLGHPLETYSKAPRVALLRKRGISDTLISRKIAP